MTSYPNIDQKTVERYRANYGLGAEIGREHVHRHWELESKLARRLLESSKENRWAVTEDCYTTLYSELPWLNELATHQEEDFSHWASLIPLRSKIYEVGSGKAQLLYYLASLGHECVATEITRERGQKHVATASNIEWHTTDGINLANFEPISTFDVVISSQLIEHIHPDDVQTHFNNVKSILKPRGRYFFDTPHRGAGPADLSRVLGFERPVCMHLKEYNFLEPAYIANQAGFSSVHAVLFCRRPIRIGPLVSRWYYHYCSAWDRITELLQLSPSSERTVRKMLRLAFVPTNVWLCAHSPF